MKASIKQIKPFTNTISGLERISERVEGRRSTTGNAITRLLGQKREATAEHYKELQAGLDKTYALKADHEAVRIKHTVSGTLPYVLITNSPAGQPEISYSISPNHNAPEPQTLTFEKQQNGAYAIFLHHYVNGEVVADSVDFDGLENGQQVAITAMVDVINDRYEQGPQNFNVTPLPSPYLAE